jgi:hypothetical protein
MIKMMMCRRLIVLVLWTWSAALGTTAAQAATPCAEPGGIGGTGMQAQGGTGGTGAPADSGLGGTGISAQADLGMIGVITGFGSICVNGIEVHYGKATPVTVNGVAADTSALALGQTVAIRAVGSGSEARAHTIAVVDAVIGPATVLNLKGEEIHVLGQRVQLSPSTVFGTGLSRQELGQTGAGQSLRVSGLRLADGAIVATRVDRAPQGDALAYGPLSRDASGAHQMGGLHIDLGSALIPPTVANIDSVMVSGKLRDGRLVAEHVRTDPRSEALAPGRFIVQGYVAELRGLSELHADKISYSIRVDPGTRIANDNLVRMSGRIGVDGTRVIERIEHLAEPFNPRALDAAPRATSRGGQEDRRGRDSSGSGSDDRGGSGKGDSSGSSGSSDRGDRSGSSDRPDRPDSRGRR